MISILFPTVRPELFDRAFATIAPACGVVPYEVIVVADFGPRELPKTTWVMRERLGPVDAIAMAQLEAVGDYLFVFNDESWLDEGALASLYHHALANPGQVLTPYVVPRYTLAYYGKPFAAFPFVHRDVVKKLGGLFDTAYHGFYADPDFSMRAHAAGVPVAEVHAAVSHHRNGHDEIKARNWNAWIDQDRATFRARWDHLGVFCDC